MMKESAYYTPVQVAIAALIGGPLAGAWLMRKNYQLLDEGRKKRGPIISLIVFCLIALVLIQQLLRELPAALSFFMVSWLSPVVIFYLLVKNLQEKMLAKKGVKRAGRQSSFYITVTCAVCFVLTYGLLISLPGLFQPMGGMDRSYLPIK